MKVRFHRLIFLPLGFALYACATAGETPRPGHNPGIGAIHAPRARIEKAGNGYLLTTDCRGTHSIYLVPSPDVNLDLYLDRAVEARYEQVQVQESVQCVRAPCNPVSVTKARILSVHPLGPAKSGQDCDPR